MIPGSIADKYFKMFQFNEHFWCAIHLKKINIFRIMKLASDKMNKLYAYNGGFMEYTQDLLKVGNSTTKYLLFMFYCFFWVDGLDRTYLLV